MIYLDNNATTPVAPEVRDAMLPWLGDEFGNPSSLCASGRRARKSVDRAREQVAGLIHASPEEIVFTGCGTESNNAAIHSALATQPGKTHIVTSAVEHSAILDYLRALERRGMATFTLVGVDPLGRLDLEALAAALRPETALVSIIWANNETGVVSPIGEAAGIAADHGVPFHTDAVNAAAKVELDVRAPPLQFLSLGGHKFHAPKGVGALFVRSGLRFEPLLIGGGQENGRRSGTEAVPSLMGLGAAAELGAAFVGTGGTGAVRKLRDRLEARLVEAVEGIAITGDRSDPEARLANTLHLSIEGVRADELILLLDDRGLCASAGSACSSGAKEPSHVLTAMGFDRDRAFASIRLSLSRYTTEEEIDRATDILTSAIDRIRSLG